MIYQGSAQNYSLEWYSDGFTCDFEERLKTNLAEIRENKDTINIVNENIKGLDIRISRLSINYRLDYTIFINTIEKNLC